MTPGQIRPVALAVLRHGDSILVFEGHDATHGRPFYRPLGGGIEFGEPGAQAVVRELREELGAELADVRYLATLENIFAVGEKTGHEIVLLYEARLADPSYYERGEFVSHEEDGVPVRVLWQPLAFFADGHAPLYPNGLLELLTP